MPKRTLTKPKPDPLAKVSAPNLRRMVKRRDDSYAALEKAYFASRRDLHDALAERDRLAARLRELEREVGGVYDRLQQAHNDRDFLAAELTELRRQPQILGDALLPHKDVDKWLKSVRQPLDAVDVTMAGDEGQRFQPGLPNGLTVADFDALIAALSEPLPQVETKAGPTWMGVTKKVAPSDPAPDAGLVVVSQPYCMWMSVTDYGLFCEWDYRWMVADGWRYTGCRIVFAASGWMSHEVNISPSHLTIADGRGEGEVGASDVYQTGWMWSLTRPWVAYYAAVGTLWWHTPLGPPEAFAYHHDYGGPQWWHPDESTVLDCAAVPHAMTWRAA